MIISIPGTNTYHLIVSGSVSIRAAIESSGTMASCIFHPFRLELPNSIQIGQYIDWSSKTGHWWDD